MLNFFLRCFEKKHDSKTVLGKKTELYDPELPDYDKLKIIKENMRLHVEGIKKIRFPKTQSEIIVLVEELPVYEFSDGHLVKTGETIEYFHTEKESN